MSRKSKKNISLSYLFSQKHAVNQIRRNLQTNSQSPVIKVFWDIENVCGNEYQIISFVTLLKSSLVERFNLGSDSWFSINIYHDPTTDYQINRSVALKNKLMNMGVTLIDIGNSNPQQADKCIKRHMKEVLRTWKHNPGDVVTILISGDAGFIDILTEFHEQHFATFLVANFDCLATKYKSIRWLEIWNFFVIANGNTDKIQGRKHSETGLHPCFGPREYTRQFGFVTPKSFKDILVC